MSCGANQNDVIKNVAVVMSAVKRGLAGQWSYSRILFATAFVVDRRVGCLGVTGLTEVTSISSLLACTQ